jgi:hypothetical protein
VADFALSAAIPLPIKQKKPAMKAGFLFSESLNGLKRISSPEILSKLIEVAEVYH